MAAGQSIDLQADLDCVETCAHETLRLKPVAPILPLQALRNTQPAGIDIPAGTICMFLMRPGAVNERHFSDPTSFDPGRWLKGNGAETADGSSAKRISMPVGAGPRICPGQYLALLEMKIAIAMLLGGFDIASVETAAGGEVEEHLAFTMAPTPLKLRLKPR